MNKISLATQYNSRIEAYWRAIGVALVIVLVLAGCGTDSSQTQQQIPPPSVVVEAARMKDVTEQRTFTGRIESVDTVQIRARVQGYLYKRDFKEGAEVQKGELLFEIERDSFEIAVAEAEAGLASAKAALTLAQPQVWM